jgi:hypothetical protein
MKNHPQIMKNQGPSIKLVEIDSKFKELAEFVYIKLDPPPRNVIPLPPLPPHSHHRPFPPCVAARDSSCGGSGAGGGSKVWWRCKIHQCRKGIHYE